MLSLTPDAALRSLRKQLQEVYDILTTVEETHPRKHKRHSPTAVKARIHGMITEIDVLQTRPALDGPAFPHILDRVLALADYEGLMALRGANRALQRAADARLFAHVALISPSTETALVAKIKHRVVVAVGHGGFVLCTPGVEGEVPGRVGGEGLSDECRFLPHLPSAMPSEERARLIKAVDYYGPRPSPCVQDLLATLRDTGSVRTWRSEADWAAEHPPLTGDAGEGGESEGSERDGTTLSIAYPIVARDDMTYTVRPSASTTTSVVHLTWPTHRTVGQDETPVIVDLFAPPGSDAYIVIEKPDPDVQLPLLGVREQIGLYLGAGIAEAFPAPSNGGAGGEAAAGAAGAVGGAGPDTGAEGKTTANPPPRITIVGLEGLLPEADAKASAALVQCTLDKLARYIQDRYGVDVAQHVSAMSHDEWAEKWRKREGWARLAVEGRLPYTSNEVALSCE